MKNNNQKNTWQLWKKEFRAAHAGGKEFLFQTDYAWINPDGIITEHRPSNPYGCLPTKMLYIHDDGFHQWDITGESIDFLKSYGWKRAKHKMNDEHLEKGLLLLYL